MGDARRDALVSRRFQASPVGPEQGTEASGHGRCKARSASPGEARSAVGARGSDSQRCLAACRSLLLSVPDSVDLCTYARPLSLTSLSPPSLLLQQPSVPLSVSVTAAAVDAGRGARHRPSGRTERLPGTRVRRAGGQAVTLRVPPACSLGFGRQDFAAAHATQGVHSIFPDEDRGSDSSGRIHTVSLCYPRAGAASPGKVNQGDLFPEKAAAVLPRTDSIFASFQFLPSVCWEDADQLLWHSQGFQHMLPAALTRFIRRGMGGVGRKRWGLRAK